MSAERFELTKRMLHRTVTLEGNRCSDCPNKDGGFSANCTVDQQVTCMLQESTPNNPLVSYRVGITVLDGTDGIPLLYPDAKLIDSGIYACTNGEQTRQNGRVLINIFDTTQQRVIPPLLPRKRDRNP